MTLVRMRQAELNEQFDALLDLLEVGEACPWQLDAVLREYDWLARIANARLGELEAPYG